MTEQVKYAFIFPGQGESHSVGMAKDFYEQFSQVRELFDEASHLTKVDLAELIFEGPLERLSKTDYCQLAIYVVSMAIWKVFTQLHPEITPSCIAGLSLGEYSAATAAGILSFEDGVKLVFERGRLMQEACDQNPSSMAVVLGLTPQEVKNFLNTLDCPHDLWMANLNCPGQVVVSGTHLGIEKLLERSKESGAKRILPLNVAGAFHSPLMKKAEEVLQEQVKKVELKEPTCSFYMNAVGKKVQDGQEIRSLLTQQITHPVLWQSCIEGMKNEGVTHYIELGPGKVLQGLNKRIKVDGETYSINVISDLEKLPFPQNT